MQHHQSQKLVLKVIAAGFILCFFLFASSLFFPPDMSQNPPVYKRPTLILQSLSVALLIFSCTTFGLHLAEQKRLLPAAGFTMFAIANGVGIVIFFEMRQFTIEEYEKIYDIFASSTALFIPACILIAFYDDVPKWMRFLPMIYVSFQTTSIVLYYCGYEQYNILDQVAFFGYLVLMLTVFLWGILIWKQAGRIKPIE